MPMVSAQTAIGLARPVSQRFHDFDARVFRFDLGCGFVDRHTRLRGDIVSLNPGYKPQVQGIGNAAHFPVVRDRA